MRILCQCSDSTLNTNCGTAKRSAPQPVLLPIWLVHFSRGVAGHSHRAAKRQREASQKVGANLDPRPDPGPKARTPSYGARRTDSAESSIQLPAATIVGGPTWVDYLAWNGDMMRGRGILPFAPSGFPWSATRPPNLADYKMVANTQPKPLMRSQSKKSTSLV